MAIKYSEAIFAPVLPQMRSLELIRKDLSVLTGSSSDEITKKQTLEIEQAIKEGETLFRTGAYTAALDKYREARAKIYKILYPGFDIGKYLVTADKILPQSITLHNELIKASGKFSNMIIPLRPELEFNIGVVTEPVPDNLTEFMKSGLMESKDISSEIQEAAVSGIELMHNRNYTAAIEVMEPVLKKVFRSDKNAESGLTGALELNLASAYLQSDNIKLSEKYSSAASKSFTKAKDNVGVAQSTYISGLAAKKKGDARNSAKLLAKASEILKRSEASTKDKELNTFSNNLLINSKNKIGGIISSSTSTDALNNIKEMKTNDITYRVPGRGFGWGTIPIDPPAVEQQLNKSWKIGITNGQKTFTYTVGAGQPSIADKLQNDIYKSRAGIKEYKKIKWVISDTTSATAYLSQLYSFTLPVKIGDCYHELGQYDKAEEYYLQAAEYSFLNKAIEGVQLWIKLAKNILDHANSNYKNEAFADAKSLYRQIVNTGVTIPSSFLYTNAAISEGASQAKTLIQKISDRPLPDINKEIAEIILSANSFLLQLDSNLDFYGLLLSPIHTFEFLQSVARGFAQQAIQSEREFITFKGQQENEAATRRDLETTVAMAQAETDARFQLWKAAEDDEAAAKNALDLAKRRRDNAVTQKNEYAAASLLQVWGQAASLALSGGEDAYWSEIKELVDKLNRGESIEGPGPKIAAAESLRGGLKTREYELNRMQDNIDELNAAIPLAQNQLNASHARTAAAEIAYQAAIQRQAMAQEALNAFDDEFFTPDAWGKMADVLRDISRSFLFRAIRIAKLMERAYNFDNDSSLNVIKDEYGFAVANSANTANATLLGGDSLLSDIESFTYSAIADKTRKSSRIKDVISIASNFPFQFEEFKRTGLLSFETDLYEFDRLHPGFYEQRIETIEIEIIGVIPDSGLNGTFQAGGVTRFRRKNNTAGERVHQIDTSALSDFVLRNDMFLYSSETGVRGLFQGFGVGSTYELHLPRRGNNFDLRRIFDINLVLYYTAKFDQSLKQTILSLPVRPGELDQFYNFSLRYDFPDAWYSYYKNGKVTFQMERARLPFNQQSFNINSVSFRVVTKPGISNEGIEVKVTAPDGTSGTDVTDVNGVVSSLNAPMSGLNGQDPLGSWSVEVLSGDAISENGNLKFDRVYNIQMGLEYSFEYIPEEI